MNRRGRGLAAAILAPAIAVAALVAGTGPVAAECSAIPIPTLIRPYIGYAFEATVSSVSRDPTQRKPGNARFDWEVRLQVTRHIRGSVPRAFLVDGWIAGCGWFGGASLSVGDKLLVSSGTFYLPTLSDNLLVWRRAGHGWTFDYEATRPHDGGGPGAFPPAAERATTTAKILALIDPDQLPATDTRVQPSPIADPGLAWLLFAPGLAGLVVIWRRRTR